MSLGETHRGASQEIPRAGLSLDAGMGFGAVQCDYGYPEKQGRAPGTYRYTMAKEKQRQPRGTPKGEAQRCAGPAALRHASQPPRAPWAPIQSPLLK